MAQKSISVLHRIDSSMVWDSFIFNKNYKWLSYNLWFIYFQFYKIIFFIDQDKFLIYNSLHFKNNILKKKKFNNYSIMSKNLKRFCYYIDLYCIEFYNYIILLNLYFSTNLSYLNKKKKKKKKKKTSSTVKSFIVITLHVTF